MVFSNVPQWSTIVDWAQPLYQLDDQTPQELIEVAREIRTAHKSDAARVGAALQWVQNQIRYFGVELGADSHLPARPDLTLRRRFGDCKGKTLLLINLLRELDIDSEPALVDSSHDLGSPDNPWFLHAFDHVIVHLTLDGKSHWLDPTRTYQRGALQEFHQPDYGLALIIAPGENSLRSMKNAYSASLLSIENTLDLPAETTKVAELVVRSTRERRLAESFRRDQDSDTLKEMGERYSKFYRGLYNEVEQMRLPQVIDEKGNRLVVEESYKLSTFWQEEDGEKYRWLWANDLVTWFADPPDPVGRTQAFQQAHPVDVRESWTVKFSRKHLLDDLDKRIETPWFVFDKSHTLSSDGKELKVQMQYTSLTDHVLPKDLAEYKKQVELAEDNASFLVYHEPPDEGALATLKSFFADEDQAKSRTGQIIENAEMGGIGLGALIAGIVMLRRKFTSA